MRSCHLLGIALAALFPGGFVAAQSTIDVLERELSDAKQQQVDQSSQNLTNFFAQVDGAMGSPDAAVQLYQAANGPMPDPTPVTTIHDTESATERAARLTQDQANVQKLGILLELHCGLMHYAAVFVTDPNRKGLHDQWVGWLQQAAQLYTQLGDLNPPVPPGGAEAPVHHHHRQEDGGGGGAPAPPPAHLSLVDLKYKTMHDSIISKFLNFQGWGSSDQGGWSVSSIPSLYKAAVLDPSRTPPTATTLADWDVYIGMLGADVRDQDKWNQIDYPPLAFQRACDDYAITPSTEKLEGLIKFASGYPTYPGVKDWYTQIQGMIADYKKQHGGTAVQSQATQPTGPATNSNITVTEVQQGDATIITTHTNGASATPPAPH